MLNREQATEFGRRVAQLFQNRHNDDVQGVLVGGGWFPLNLDEVLEGVQDGEAWAGDELAINLGPEPANLNEGFEQSPIQYEVAEDNDNVLIAILRLDGNRAQGAQEVSVNATTGAVTLNGNTRALPEGYELRDARYYPVTSLGVEDGYARLSMPVNQVVVEDDDEGIDEYDDDYCY